MKIQKKLYLITDGGGDHNIINLSIETAVTDIINPYNC